jgi:hypothetical protein
MKQKQAKEDSIYIKNQAKILDGIGSLIVTYCTQN